MGVAADAARVGGPVRVQFGRSRRPRARFAPVGPRAFLGRPGCEPGPVEAHDLAQAERRAIRRVVANAVSYNERNHYAVTNSEIPERSEHSHDYRAIAARLTTADEAPTRPSNTPGRARGAEEGARHRRHHGAAAQRPERELTNHHTNGPANLMAGPFVFKPPH